LTQSQQQATLSLSAVPHAVLLALRRFIGISRRTEIRRDLYQLLLSGLFIMVRATEDVWGQRMKVFVSYSLRDEGKCRELADCLSERGHVVWVDRSSIPPGRSYYEAIETGIRDADAVLVLLSKSVHDKPEFVADEVQLAEHYKKLIIPVQVDRIDSMPPGLELPLHNHQRIVLWRDYSEGLDRLVAVLDADPVLEESLTAILKKRGKRGIRKAKIALRDKEVGKKALKYGGAVAVGAIAVAGAAARAQSASAEADTAKAIENLRTAEVRYRQKVYVLVSDCANEFEYALEMTPAAYRTEFRPRVQRLLGRLEETSPPRRLEAAHRDLLSRLETSVAEFDATMAKVEAQDWDGVRAGLIALQQRWMHTLQAHASLINAEED
jgi:TIR domain